MEAVPATQIEIDQVFGDLDKESRREIELSGSDTFEAREMFKTLASFGLADAIRYRGEVLAIFVWTVQSGTIETGFLAKERFFRPDVPSVRFLGKHFRRLQDRCGGVPLVSHSYSNRPAAPRWFKLIGYDFIGTDGPCRIYQMPRRSPPATSTI